MEMTRMVHQNVSISAQPAFHHFLRASRPARFGDSLELFWVLYAFSKSASKIEHAGARLEISENTLCSVLYLS